LLSGFLFGLAYFVVGLWWIFISLHDIGGMNAALSVAAVVLLSAYMALFFGLASALGRMLRHQSIFLNSAIMAAAWVLLEYLRGQLFTGFPWVGFAEAQVNGPFAAIAPLAGWLRVYFFGGVGIDAIKSMAPIACAHQHSDWIVAGVDAGPQPTAIY
jgi:apolipoprotein N-acyltransferase